MDWQTIETAPKDGREIIIYHPNGGVGLRSQAWWSVERSTWVTPSGFVQDATHWMPLFLPPGAV